jgi:hypothetical protein
MSINTEKGDGMDASSHIEHPSAGLTRRTAMAFVILLGVVSLFADMIYEGARSITGPYLAVLGASATVVGVVAGFGELIGYMLRLAAGCLSDRTGRYWTFAGRLRRQCAGGAFPGARRALGTRRRAHDRGTLRQGDSHRPVTPCSHATTEMGRGWGWAARGNGQIGALLGPLIVAAVLFRRGGYPTAFGVLLIPALLALGVLVLARLSSIPIRVNLRLARHRWRRKAFRVSSGCIWWLSG